MAEQKHIETTHKGEPLEILFEAKNGDGSVISNPDDQTVTFTVAKTKNGPTVLAFDAPPQVAMTDAENGLWLIQLDETDLAGLQQENTYHFNIWSQRAGYAPRLQVYGRLKRLRSIRYT